MKEIESPRTTGNKENSSMTLEDWKKRHSIDGFYFPMNDVVPLKVDEKEFETVFFKPVCYRPDHYDREDIKEVFFDRDFPAVAVKLKGGNLQFGCCRFSVPCRFSDIQPEFVAVTYLSLKSKNQDKMLAGCFISEWINWSSAELLNLFNITEIQARKAISQRERLNRLSGSKHLAAKEFNTSIGYTPENIAKIEKAMSPKLAKAIKDKKPLKEQLRALNTDFKNRRPVQNSSWDAPNTKNREIDYVVQWVLKYFKIDRIYEMSNKELGDYIRHKLNKDVDPELIVVRLYRKGITFERKQL